MSNDDQITTVEGLEVLPEGSIVLDADGDMMQRLRVYGRRSKNATLGWFFLSPSSVDGATYLPATVLFRPDRPVGVSEEASIEVRRNEDGTLDEVVARGAFFHLEQMDDSEWWMGIETPGGSIDVTLHTKRAAITATVSERVGEVRTSRPPATVDAEQVEAAVADWLDSRADERMNHNPDLPGTGEASRALRVEAERIRNGKWRGLTVKGGEK